MSELKLLTLFFAASFCHLMCTELLLDESDLEYFYPSLLQLEHTTYLRPAQNEGVAVI